MWEIKNDAIETAPLHLLAPQFHRIHAVQNLNHLLILRSLKKCINMRFCLRIFLQQDWPRVETCCNQAAATVLLEQGV